MEHDMIAKELRRLLRGRNNDPVKLAFLSQEDAGQIDRLDLRCLAELKRSEKGAVEVRLIDRIRVAELLDLLEQRRKDSELGGLLNSFREGDRP